MHEFNHEVRVYGEDNAFGVLLRRSFAACRIAQRVLEAAGFMVEVDEGPSLYASPAHPARREGDAMLDGALAAHDYPARA